ncbi:MAG: hypothetical protein FWH57_11150 [Oscillospiraceae bacterium]|nr:hypothetical protein [Oscillospiraceae bacterium]
MIDYAFEAGGFKLGDRVEILTTGQRGILISEIIHISGCNTYQILLPNVLIEGKMKITYRDYLLLRKLEPGESLFDATKELTDDNSFSPKGTDVNAEWIRAAVSENKEFVPEIDDAVGSEEITIRPGMEVWNKVYGKTMIVSYIFRDIFSKELEYGSMYMEDNKEVFVCSRSYALIPLENKLNVPSAEKFGPLFEDGRDNIIFGNKFSHEMFNRY